MVPNASRILAHLAKNTEVNSSISIVKGNRDTIYLRNSENDLRVPLFKTANGQKSFAYRGANLWNKLEPEVKKAPSLFVLKHRL